MKKFALALALAAAIASYAGPGFHAFAQDATTSGTEQSTGTAEGGCQGGGCPGGGDQKHGGKKEGKRGHHGGENDQAPAAPAPAQ